MAANNQQSPDLRMPVESDGRRPYVSPITCTRVKVAPKPTIGSN